MPIALLAPNFSGLSPFRKRAESSWSSLCCASLNFSLFNNSVSNKSVSRRSCILVSPSMTAFLPILPIPTQETLQKPSRHLSRRSRTPYLTVKPNRSASRVPQVPYPIPETTTKPQSPRKAISSLRNVSYDVSGVRVVEDVSLDLYEGEIVCILGPSGSGKSTILRILAGLTQPSEGQALCHGKPFEGTNPVTSIVFQTFALYPWLTVLENVELGLTHTSAATRDYKRVRAMSAIDIIGLDGYENAYPRELSGGMRQRVGFARALAVEPELLCMDEPFSALDVLTAENLRSELLRLWQAGDVPTTSVLIVTHGIEEAVSLADRIVILGRDPGHIRTVLPIDLPHPRDRKSQMFQNLTDAVYTILSNKDEVVPDKSAARVVSNDSNYTEKSGYTISDGNAKASAVANVPYPLEPLQLSDPLMPMDVELASDLDIETIEAERYPQLPAVRIGSVGGLLSFIAEEPVDLYLLGQRLQLDVDDLYPLIDAASILGLIELDDGDVRINAKGQQFDEASIDDRKNIVQQAALTAPGARLIAQIHRLLSQAATQKLPQELIFDTILLKHFSPNEARKQLEIAIEWGRFAELFGYESLTGMLFLDTGLGPDEIMQTS